MTKKMHTRPVRMKLDERGESKMTTEEGTEQNKTLTKSHQLLGKNDSMSAEKHRKKKKPFQKIAAPMPIDIGIIGKE